MGKYLELLNREKCRTMLPLLWTETADGHKNEECHDCSVIVRAWKR